MDPKELMVGSHAIHSRYGNVVLKKEDFNNWDFDEVNPMPLTPENIVQFSYKWMSPEYVDTKASEYNMIVYWMDGEFVHFINSPYTLRLKYVHEFQRLYLSLTGNHLVAIGEI